MLINSYSKQSGALLPQTDFLNARAPIRTIPAHLKSIVKQKTTKDHIYLEAGQGKPVIFCHGLLGGVFNIETVCREIAREYRFLMPYLPMYDRPISESNVEQLGDYLESFIEELGLHEAVIIGTSMGADAALHYSLKPTNRLKGLVVCGSAGLGRIKLEKGFFKRKDFDFVRLWTHDIFRNPEIVPDEMVADIFQALQQYDVVKKTIQMTRSAADQQLHQLLPHVNCDTLLIWGRQDPITPVELAPQFEQLIPTSRLKIINECGHVPTQEKPFQFLELFHNFMKKIGYGNDSM